MKKKTTNPQFKLLGIHVNDLDIKNNVEIQKNINSVDFFNYQKVLKKGYFAFDNTFDFSEKEESFTRLETNPINIYNVKDGQKIIINAVVGKNGSGKSSIFELLMLMIYNLSIKKGVLTPTYPNKDEASSNYMPYLKASLYYESNEKIYRLKFDITENSSNNEINTISYHFFENGRFKEIERNLDKQSKKFDLNDFCYGIGLNYSVFGLNNDIMGDWIQQLFHKNDGYQTPLVLNPYKENGEYSINEEIKLSIDRMITNVYSVPDFQNNLTVSDDYKLSRVVHEIIEDEEKIKINSILRPLFDIKHLDSDENSETKQTDNSDWTLKGTYPNANYIPIDFIYDPTNYKYYHFDLGSKSKLTFSDFFGYIISLSENKEKIIELFSKIIDKSTISETNKLVINQSISYIVYKLYKIAYTYPSNFRDIIDYSNKELNVKYIIETVFQDKSHITLKLRRTIFFLSNIDNISNNVDFQIEKSEGNYSVNIFQAENLFKFYKETENSKLVYTDSLTSIAPPIYKVTITLENIKTHAEVNIYNLSSGEVQMMLSTHCILYHLINVNSVQKANNNIKYKNVIVLLDEIELYFHPDYQKNYINSLLKLIERNKKNLKDIKSIQMIFSTHSPFILSDIPSQNVLKLKNGIAQPTDEKNNSFAANIHDLLNDDFFMENGTIGKFAEDKIHAIIKKEIVKMDDLKVIDLIGDPFLKGVVLSKVREKLSKEAINKEIERLQKLKASIK